MPDVASVLRDEISRLARKEIRQQVGPLKKINAELRRTLSALKSEVTALKRKVDFLEKREASRLGVAPKESVAKAVRFSPKWVKADRQRLGLSAKAYGAVIDGTADNPTPIDRRFHGVLTVHLNSTNARPISK